MIIGGGLVGSAFKRYWDADPSVIVFASGVSNSKETRVAEFTREREALMRHSGTGALLLYFGSCSIADPELSDTPYVRHKQDMEDMVARFARYAIFRLPQVVGRSQNPNTLTNFLHGNILAGTRFQVWRQARRNLIDVDDIAAIVHELVRSGFSQATANIAAPFSTSVLEVVHIFERVLGKPAIYDLVEGGGSYAIEAELARQTAARLGIQFEGGYVEAVLRKYYG